MSTTGNLRGLKPDQRRRIEKLGNRRVPAARIVSPELARSLSELSHEVGRQLGLILDRRGHVIHVVVGTATGVEIPDLTRHRAGAGRLRGLRLVHTHLRGEPLTDDDFTDLALLRLDLVTAILVGDDGLPATMHSAHLRPGDTGAQPWDLLEPHHPAQEPTDFGALMRALEQEFTRLANGRLRRVDVPRALAVHATTDSLARAEESVAELLDLANTCGVEVVDVVRQRRPRIDPRFVLGRGKVQDVVIRAMQLGADILLFNRDLTPGQLRNLATMTELKIIDRTQLILDIFAQHAHTVDGKLQVELAQLRYNLPRLVGHGTAMSRLAGGIGGRGPGETKLEIGRRRARDRIAHLERQLKAAGRRRDQRRHRRQARSIPIISIVGYTNAGKSTLLNALTNSAVTVENQLFATLDTASRRLRFPNEREVIITDTVGFIRDLPAELLKAFATTLEELRDADLLLHVVDAAHPAVGQHIQVVEDTLGELGLADIPRVLVFNKVDLLTPAVRTGLADRPDAIAISALDRATFAPVLELVEAHCWPARPRAETA